MLNKKKHCVSEGNPTKKVFSAHQPFHDRLAQAEIVDWYFSLDWTNAPKDFFESKENRISAVGWLVRKIGRENICPADFSDNGLGGLLDHYRSDAVMKAYEKARKVFSRRKVKPTPVGGCENGCSPDLRGLLKAQGDYIRKPFHSALDEYDKEVKKGNHP